MNNEILAPLQNGERAADNLEHKIAAEGISYDLKIQYRKERKNYRI